MKGIFISVLIVGAFISWMMVVMSVGILRGLVLLVGVIAATCVLLIWNEKGNQYK